MASQTQASEPQAAANTKPNCEGNVVVFKDRSPSAQQHLLVTPLNHLDGVKELSAEHVPLLQEMEAAGNRALDKLSDAYPPEKRIVEQEAWFYEELEQVQGIAVPRCYGLFQAHIEPGSEVSAWKEERKHEFQESDESSESGYGSPKFDWDTPDPNGERVPSFPPPDPTLITILLFERLGERMPINEPLDIIKPGVYEIYNDISRLGIEHLDIRWSNILSVQDSDHQPPEKVCPNHGHAHRWRIVDFDLARKSNGRIDYLDYSAGNWLQRLFMNLPNGVIIEPWDW
ncbi:hypothetical protein Clacol_002512 [Clathrus columnatus]|uniref:Protein kinase domain-containing protein n=1 Tax=Clathrus columnatus TaxID=1419009 RepID=A0AAV5A6X2_9AGAM|nr:hypothetical protein Clacol_002512 [Clathrus columnatus]